MTTAVSSREFKADWREDPSPGARDVIGAPIEHLEMATILSATGSFAWKPASGEILWSDEMHRIFALDEGRSRRSISSSRAPMPTTATACGSSSIVRRARPETGISSIGS